MFDLSYDADIDDGYHASIYLAAFGALEKINREKWFGDGYTLALTVADDQVGLHAESCFMDCFSNMFLSMIFLRVHLCELLHPSSMICFSVMTSPCCPC